MPVTRNALLYLSVAKSLQPFLAEQKALLPPLHYVMLYPLHQELCPKCTKKLKPVQNADDCQLNRLSHWEPPVLAKLQWVAIAFPGECEMLLWFGRALSETCVTERHPPPTETCHASLGTALLLWGQNAPGSVTP